MEGFLCSLEWEEEVVMPAEAGIQWCRTWMWSSCKDLDSGIRRNDGQEWAGEVVMPADPGSGSGAGAGIQ